MTTKLTAYVWERGKGKYRGSGKPHGDITRPNIKETTIDRTPDGREFVSKPKVRKPEPEEYPNP